jgi:hypothetical protein
MAGKIQKMLDDAVPIREEAEAKDSSAEELATWDCCS